MVNVVQNNTCIEYAGKVQVAVLYARNFRHIRNLKLSTANSECWGFAFKRVDYITNKWKRSGNI